MKFFIRTVESKRFYNRKHRGFQDGIDGAASYGSWQTAQTACVKIEELFNTQCEYIDQSELDAEVKRMRNAMS